MSDIRGQSSSPTRRRKLIESIRLPQVSGKASALWLIGCFALTALLVPMTVRLPLWIDFEIVVAVWWCVWAGILSRMLYLGWRISDDHRLGQSLAWFSSGERGGRSRSSGGWLSWLDVPTFDLEGCAWVLAIGAALFIAASLIWFVVEIALPVVAFLLYCVVRGMLAKVLNDEHGCRGNFARALGYGLLWATIYTAPLAGVIWLIHRIHPQPQ